MLHRVGNQFGVELPLRTLFEAPTIRRLASLLDSSASADSASVVSQTSAFPPLIPDLEHADDPYPLSEMQQAYWVGRSDVELGRVGTHLYVEIELAKADQEACQFAWQTLINRHDALRTIFTADGSQHSLSNCVYRIAFSQESGGSPATSPIIPKSRERMVHRTFDPANWPQFEIAGVDFGGGCLILQISVDLILLDAWSLRILLREFLSLVSDPGASLPKTSLRFRDYVLYREFQRNTDSYKQRLNEARVNLDTLPMGPQIPLVQSPSELGASVFHRFDARIEREEWERLSARAAGSAITPAGLVLAAYADVLACWSAENRFAINIPVFHRPAIHPDIQQIAGQLSSYVLVGISIDETTSFEQFARTVQKSLWAATDFNAPTGLEVRRELAQWKGDLAGNPWPIVLTFAPQDPILERIKKETGYRIGFSRTQTSQVWIDNLCGERDGNLEISWDTVENLFPAGLLDAMFAAYVQLLHDLATDEASWTRTRRDYLPIDQRARRMQFNQTSAPIEETTVTDLVWKQVQHIPASTAIISEGDSVTYDELWRFSVDVAEALVPYEVGPGHLVGIALRNRSRQPQTALGIMMTGAAYVPLDADLPPNRISEIVRRTGVKVIISDSNLRSTLSDSQAVILDAASIKRQNAVPSSSHAATPRSLAYVLFTSGSTGTPKGVMIDHLAVVNTLIDINHRFGITSRDRVLAFSRLSFDLSVYDIFGTLAAGASVLVPNAEALADPALLAEFLGRERVTVWNSVPLAMQMVVERLEAQNSRGSRDLRLVLLSGDWIPVGLPARIARFFPHAQLVSLGGATEASIWSVFHIIRPEDGKRISIPYGTPLRNQTLHVLNQNLRSCPDGTEGDLYIGGAGLARGYWRDETESTARFFRHPETGERLYHTGDRARFLAEGCIEFCGRRDSQVKIRGFRVDLQEIEAFLSRAPEVAACVVTASGAGSNVRSLVAYVVPAGPTFMPEDLRAFMSGNLPDYMVPQHFVRLDRLPLTSNGKLDRRRLPEPAIAARTETRCGKPVNAEERVVEILSSLIGVPVTRESNLLELGATSVDLMRCVNRLETEFGKRPSLRALFRDPTVATLIRELEGISDDSSAGTRGPLDTFPNFASITDAVERKRFKAEQRALRRFDSATSYPLIPTDQGMIVRRSYRHFVTAPLPFERLSNLLSGLCRSENDRYNFGSAGGLYPVQVYLHLKPERVRDLNGGIYYLHPAEHRLILINTSLEIPRNIHLPFVNMSAFEECAFSIFLVADLAAIAPIYPERAIHFVTLEAGAMVQLLEERAEVTGLGLCQIGALDFDSISHLFQLSRSHVFVHCLIGGMPDEGCGDSSDVMAALSSPPARVRGRL
jgi:amino acid adenylation domain-containing protein